MTTRVLITGAGGFIGKHLTLELLGHQHFKVRVFLLPSEKADFIASLEEILRFHHSTAQAKTVSSRFPDIETTTGDLRNLSDVMKACAHCDWVFHLGGISHLWIPQAGDYEAVNVGGTRNVCEAAKRHGVDKLIFTSTCEAVARNPHNPMALEDFVLTEADCTGPYALSKFRAEKIVEKYAAGGRCAVIVNPSLPLGPGDAIPSPVGKMVLFFLNNPGPFYYSTGFNFVDVHHLAQGHLAAAQKGRSKQRYILGGPNLPIETFFQKMALFSGKKMPSQNIPYSLALTFSRAMQSWSDWISHEPPLSSVEGLKSVRRPFYFDCSKARNELGWSCESIDEALKTEIEYYLNKKL